MCEFEDILVLTDNLRLESEVTFSVITRVLAQENVQYASIDEIQFFSKIKNTIFQN